MKWLFIIIALTNIGFFGYNTFYKIDKNSISKSITKTDKTQIVLLSEVAQVEVELPVMSKDDNSTNVPPEQEQDQENTTPTETIVASKAEESIPQVSNVTENIVEVADAPVALEAEKIIEDKVLCYSLGPFNKKIMDEVRNKLDKDYQNQLSFEIETTSATTYYRIYVPPLENKHKIKETLELLNENKLKDHYVMSIDGRKNAIALGVFKQRNAAEKVAKKANKIGLSTIIEAISDDKNSLYRLHVNFQQHHDIIHFQAIITEMKLKSMECENKG